MESNWWWGIIVWSHQMTDNLKKNWDFGWGLRLWQRWEWDWVIGSLFIVFHKFDQPCRCYTIKTILLKDWVKACQLFQIAFKRGGVETGRHIVLRGYPRVTGEWWNQDQVFIGHAVTSDLCKNRLNTLNWIVNNYSNSQIKKISWWNVKSEFGREVLAGKRGKTIKDKSHKVGLFGCQCHLIVSKSINWVKLS